MFTKKILTNYKTYPKNEKYIKIRQKIFLTFDKNLTNVKKN